jgi:hypothetical protein
MVRLGEFSGVGVQIVQYGGPWRTRDAGMVNRLASGMVDTLERQHSF